MIASAVLLLLQDPEPGNLRWPMGPGNVAFPLRATYGQLEGDEESADLHLGLDVLPGKKGEPVYAIEAGTVRRVQRVGADTGKASACEGTVGPEHCGVLVVSRDVAKRAFLYLHLEEQSLAVETDQEVAAGDFLGQVVYDADLIGRPHLHLSRVGGAYASSCWADLDDLSVRNPLRLLDPATLDDAVLPEFQKLKSGSRRHHWRTEEPDPQYPATIQAGDALDLVVRVFDADGSGSGRRLAPYRIRMTITSPDGTEVREILLDGPLTSARKDALRPEDLYSLDEKYPSRATLTGKKHAFYFLPTQAEGTALDYDHHWVARAGQHEFVLEAFDAADNPAEKLCFSLDVP